MRHQIFRDMGLQMKPNDKSVNELLAQIDAVKKPVPPKRRWIAGSAVAACLAVSVTTALLLPKMAGHRYISIVPPSNSVGTISKIPGWEERSLPSKFDTMTIGGALFTSSEKKIAPSSIADFLFKTKLTGYDYTDPNYYIDREKAKKYEIDAEVYAVNSVSPNCLVAVKYNGHDDFYSFTFNNYVPKTLGELIDNLNLTENLTFQTVFYDDELKMEYTIPDQTKIWDFLLANRSASSINAQELGQFGGEMGIKISLDVLPCEPGTTIGISKSGYLFTNIMGSLKAFQIGENQANAFINDVLENWNGKVIK